MGDIIDLEFVVGHHYILDQKFTAYVRINNNSPEVIHQMIDYVEF